MMKGRDIIIFLAIKYEGDWNRIYQAIKEKEHVQEEEVHHALARVRSHVLTIIDDDYPESLKKIYKPPFVLFYYGNVQLLHMGSRSLAMIGSRKASPYGLKMTQQITQALIEEGIIVVSGLARGIDTMAHQATLDAHGKTIAVLGSGIDRCYPEENTTLYKTLCQDHLVVSEYPHNTEPHKEHFPWRNRIIAGLAQAVFVAEAKKRSGTLITVGYALYLGKDVYVLPHLASTDNSTNRLIKDGAILVESAQDIVEHMLGQHEQKGSTSTTENHEKKFI
jgi:DNA processing protein